MLCRRIGCHDYCSKQASTLYNAWHTCSHIDGIGKLQKYNSYKVSNTIHFFPNKAIFNHNGFLRLTSLDLGSFLQYCYVSDIKDWELLGMPVSRQDIQEPRHKMFIQNANPQQPCRHEFLLRGRPYRGELPSVAGKVLLRCWWCSGISIQDASNQYFLLSYKYYDLPYCTYCVVLDIIFCFIYLAPSLLVYLCKLSVVHHINRPKSLWSDMLWIRFVQNFNNSYSESTFYRFCYVRTSPGFLLYPDTPAKMETTSQEAFCFRPVPRPDRVKGRSVNSIISYLFWDKQPLLVQCWQ